ncbi:MAG: alpha/beta hydrolase [Myxococcales bacterium]|nr:alpha/beta hydrolase [Myxococcales bacterium]
MSRSPVAGPHGALTWAWCTASGVAIACAGPAPAPPLQSPAPDGALVDASDTAALRADAALSAPTDASQAEVRRAGPDINDGDARLRSDSPLAPATFVSVYHPKAAGIVLRGDNAPLSWTTDLAPTSVAAGVAKFILPATVGSWRVKPMRAGAWAVGPNWVVHGGKDAALWPWFDPAMAAPRREDFSLPGSLGAARTVRVWLPPGYDENTLATYPLLLLHDGQNVFEDATASFGVSWQVGAAAHAGILAAKVAELVIVGVDHAGPKRIYEYTPSHDVSVGDGGGGLAYLDWLQGKLLPAVHAKYRLRPERQAHVLGGSSLGGLVSLYGAVGHPQVWGGAVCMSGSWWWNGGAVQGWLPKAWPTDTSLRIWIDAGTIQDGLAGATQVKDALVGLGLVMGGTLGWHVAQGAKHNEASWAARVHLPLAFHFPATDREPAFK